MIFQTVAQGRTTTIHTSPVSPPGSLLFPGQENTPESALELHFVLNGAIHYHLEGLGDLNLSAGHYNMVYPPFLQTEPWSDRGPGNLEIFTVHFSTSYLQNWILFCPALTFFLEKAKKNIPSTLYTTPGIAGPEMITRIRNILDCPYTEDLRTIYLELQISALLTIALPREDNRGHKKTAGLTLTPQDIEKIEATRQYLLQNMDHPPTLVALAHKIGLNDFKLKKGYRQLYGTTLFDDFLHARMERARQLLTETSESIVGIAVAAGYKNVSSFSAAFKRYFGHTPGTLRKTS